MKPQQVLQINDVIFTPREIDIISCITNVRGVKKIANILGISPRTVEGHIRNILTKTSSNSQEDIKDFVERSTELILIKQRYADLLMNKLFLSQDLPSSSKILHIFRICIRVIVLLLYRFYKKSKL